MDRREESFSGDERGGGGRMAVYVCVMQTPDFHEEVGGLICYAYREGKGAEWGGQERRRENRRRDQHGGVSV